MRIASNIKGVIRQMERLKANIPIAAQRALAHERWKNPAIEIARGVLQPPIVRPEEQQFVEGFINTITSASLEEIGFSLSMHTPSEASASGARAREAAENNQIAGLNFDKDQTLGNLVRQWVETPFTNRDDPASGKDIQAEQGGKDFNKSDDEITRDLMWILTGADPSPSVDKARAGLMPRLQAFAAAMMAGQLPPERASLWLRAVLAAWAEMIRLQFPALLRQELQKLKGDL